MRKISLGLLLIVVLATGCPRPLRFGPEGQITDPELLLNKIDQRFARSFSVKGEAKVRLYTAADSGKAGQFIAVQRPGMLHLETLDFFGKPVAMMSSDGAHFSLFDVQSNTFYTGPATAQNLSRLLPLAIAPREAVTLLLGNVPHVIPSQMQLELQPGARAYQLTLKRDQITQTLWINTEDLCPIRSQIRGIAGYDLRLDDYELLNGVRFPKTIELQTVHANGTPAGTRVEVSYKDVEVNIPLEPELFVTPQPPGTRLVELDELGRAVKKQ